MSDCYVIGIAGGTSSGKTTVSYNIIDSIGVENISYISHDSYYKDLSKVEKKDIDKVNFDHPNSLDTELMIKDINELIKGNNIEQPIYDFKTHMRLTTTKTVISKKIILIEGILVLHNSILRNLMNIKIFVDTESDERLIRRINRDVFERDRTIESIIKQYRNTIKPMHQQFIEPSKIYSDIIIPSGYNKAAVDLVVSCLTKKIKI